MKCKICNLNSTSCFEAKILNKYNAGYFHCANCGFLQIGDPSWLEEAYKDPIIDCDTGILERNSAFCQKTSVLLYFLFNKSEKFLDYAGGLGIFTRLMRDVGFDFYWHDPYTTNIFARGFEYNRNVSNFELITSFESFEHFEYPNKEIEKMLTMSQSILFSTLLLPDPIPTPESWWYYSVENGQHIGFYSLKTLNFIAQKYSLNLYSNNSNLHLLSNKSFKKNHFIKLVKHSKKYIKTVKKHMRPKTFEDMNFVLSKRDKMQL
jgi:hypothetical protein